MSIFARSTRSVTHSLSWPQSFEKGTWRGEEGPRAEKKARRKAWHWEEGEGRRAGAQVRFTAISFPPSPSGSVGARTGQGRAWNC